MTYQFRMTILLLSFFILILGSCSKDDDKSSKTTSTKGEFTVDGKTYSLTKCQWDSYSAYGSGYRRVFFTSKDLKIYSDSISGNGNLVLLGIQLPTGQSDFVTGDYSYNSEPAYQDPSTFNGGLIIGLEQYGQYESLYELGSTSVLKIAKTGTTYAFSSSGVTEDGKSFSFEYKGSMVEL